MNGIASKYSEPAFVRKRNLVDDPYKSKFGAERSVVERTKYLLKWRFGGIVLPPVSINKAVKNCFEEVYDECIAAKPRFIRT
jgi:hypothetical protein